MNSTERQLNQHLSDLSQKSSGGIIVLLVFLCVIVDFGKSPFVNYMHDYPEKQELWDKWWNLWDILNSLFYPLAYLLASLTISLRFGFLKLILRGAAGLSFADFVDRCFGDGSEFFWYDYASIFFIVVDVLMFLYKKKEIMEVLNLIKSGLYNLFNLRNDWIIERAYTAWSVLFGAFSFPTLISAKSEPSTIILNLVGITQIIVGIATCYGIFKRAKKDEEKNKENKSDN